MIAAYDWVVSTRALILSAAAAAVLLGHATVRSQDDETDEAREQRSYGVGFVLGERVRGEIDADGVGADLDLIRKGFRAAVEGAEPDYARADMDAIMEALHEEMTGRMVNRLLAESPEFKRLHDENLALSRKFHEAFGRRKGVVTRPSGLQYKILRAGTGRSPGSSETAVVTYRITRLDGTVLAEEQEKAVRVDRVIPGGAEALQLMRVGAKWQVAIPPDLALGAAGRHPVVGPNESLVGIVELLSINPPGSPS